MVQRTGRPIANRPNTFEWRRQFASRLQGSGWMQSTRAWGGKEVGNC